MSTSPPPPREKTWYERIFEVVPSGVDETLIEENLKLTPTERVENMRRTLQFIEDARAAYADRLSPRR